MVLFLRGLELFLPNFGSKESDPAGFVFFASFGIATGQGGTGILETVWVVGGEAGGPFFSVRSPLGGRGGWVSGAGPPRGVSGHGVSERRTKIFLGNGFGWPDFFWGPPLGSPPGVPRQAGWVRDLYRVLKQKPGGGGGWTTPLTPNLVVGGSGNCIEGTHPQ